MKINPEQREYLRSMLGEERTRAIEAKAEEQLFAGPVERMGLDPETAVEIEVSGPQVARLQHELAGELRQVEGLQVEEYVRKAFDIPQLVYLAGAVGGVIQGLEVLRKWWRTKEQSGEKVTIVIRSRRIGEVYVSADQAEEAHRVLVDLIRLLATEESERESEG